MARFYCFLFVANVITYVKIVTANGPTTTDVDADSDYKLMIEDTVRLFEVDDRFLSIAFSAGQLNKTDTGINLDSIRLRNMLKALSPSYMRVGGTRANFLVFEAREDGDIINEGVENTTVSSDNANKTDNPLPDTKPVTAKPVVQHVGVTVPTIPPPTPSKASEDIGEDDASSNRPQPIKKPDNANPLSPEGEAPSAGPPPPSQSNLSEDHDVAVSGEDELESPEKATSSNSAVGAEEEEEKDRETSNPNFPYPPEKPQQTQDEQYNLPGPNQGPPLKSNDSDEDFYEKKPVKIATPSQGKKNKKLKKLKKTKKVSKRPLMVTGQDVENSNTDKEEEEENLDVNSENQKLGPEGNEPENEVLNAEADRQNERASEDIGEEGSETDGDDYNKADDENKVSNSESDGIDSENVSEENEAESSENQNEITEDDNGNEIDNENEGNVTEDKFRNEEESPSEQNENSQNEEDNVDETTNESEQDQGQDSSDETERENSDVNEEDKADELPAELEEELPGEDENEVEEGSEDPDNEDQFVPEDSEQEPNSENGTNGIVTDAETEDSNTEGDTEEDTTDEASSFGPKNENNPIILPELQTTPTTTTTATTTTTTITTSTEEASTFGPENDNSSINMPELHTTPTPTTTASTDQSTESNLDVLFGTLQTTHSPTTEKITTTAIRSTTSSPTTTTTKRPKKLKKPIIVTLPPTVKLPPLETTTPVPFKKKKMKSVKTVHDNEKKISDSLGVDLPSLLVTTTTTTTTTTEPKTRNKKNKENPIFQLPENENDEIFLISSTAKPHSTKGKSTTKQAVPGSDSKPTPESDVTSTRATTQTKPTLETTETLEDLSMLLTTTTTTLATTTPSTNTAKASGNLIELGPVSEGLSKHKKKQAGKKLSLNTKKPIKNQNKNSYKNKEKSKSKSSNKQSKFKDHFKLNMKKKPKNHKNPFGGHLQKQKYKAKSQKQVKAVDKINNLKQDDEEPLRLPTPPATTVYASTSVVTDVLGFPILSNSHTKRPTQKASTAKSTESFSTGKSIESLVTTTIGSTRLPTVTASPSVTLNKSKTKQKGKGSKQPSPILPTIEPFRTKKTTKVTPIKLTSTTPSMENDYPLIQSTTSEPVTTTPVLGDIELSPAFKNYFPNQKLSKETLFDRQYGNLVNDNPEELYGEQFYNQPIVHYYKREEVPRNILKHQRKRGKVLYSRDRPLKRYEKQVSRKLSKAKQDKLDKLSGYKNFNLTADAFDKLVQLAEDGDMRIIFDFNAFLREINTQWDPKNAKKLLDYIKLRGYKLDYQLGSEPNYYKKFGEKRNYSAQQIGQDFLLLKKVIKSKKLKGQPLIIGPDVTRPKGKRVTAWLNTFLAVAKKAIDVLAWHQYYIDGRTATVENFTDPNILDRFKEQAQEMNSIRSQNSFKKPVWLTETASAWGGGAKGLSDRYADGFMYLDKLGIAAQENISVVARQSFMMGKYALVDMKNNYEPHPSYYLAVLFKRLIGKVVLGINGGDSKFRVYAHCSKATQRRIPGSVTVYAINLNEKEVAFSFSGYQLLPAKQFLLTADSLDSDEVKLNGKVLKMDGDHLPKMLGVIVRQPIKIPAKSFGFYVLDQVSAEAC